MSMAVEQKVRVFTFDRPVNCEDPSCEPAVFGFPDMVRLMAALNRPEPHFISAPSAQGKRSALYFMRSFLSKVGWDTYRVQWIVPRRMECLSRSETLAYLALAIDGNPRASNLSELLKSSSVLSNNANQSLRTVFLIDMSACESIDVLKWITHSVYLLSNTLRSVADEMNFGIILSGCYALSALATGPSSDYEMRTLTVRNLTHKESEKLILKACRASEHTAGIRFSDSAVQLLYNNAVGDKYFTNVLAAQSTLQAFSEDGDHGILVKTTHVKKAAKLIENGKCPLEKRVLLRLGSGLQMQTKEVLWEVQSFLSKKVDLYWNDLSPRTRQFLFAYGLVCPVLPEQNGNGISEDLQALEPRNVTDYVVRNPMVRRWTNMLARKITRFKTNHRDGGLAQATEKKLKREDTKPKVQGTKEPVIMVIEDEPEQLASFIVNGVRFNKNRLFATIELFGQSFLKILLSMLEEHTQICPAHRFREIVEALFEYYQEDEEATLEIDLVAARIESLFIDRMQDDEALTEEAAVNERILAELSKIKEVLHKKIRGDNGEKYS